VRSRAKTLGGLAIDCLAGFMEPTRDGVSGPELYIFGGTKGLGTMGLGRPEEGRGPAGTC
jgi:hypothetical protein